MDQENVLCRSFPNGYKGREIAFADAREVVVEAMKTTHYSHENQRENTHLL